MDQVFVLLQTSWYYGGATEVVGVFKNQASAMALIDEMEMKAKAGEIFNFSRDRFSLQPFTVQP